MESICELTRDSQRAPPEDAEPYRDPLARLGLDYGPVGVVVSASPVTAGELGRGAVCPVNGLAA
jgi:hypothetical protein